jgi:hypothetical protein
MDSWDGKRPLRGWARLRLRLLPLASLCVLAAAAGSASATPPASFDPLVEARNFAITLQRQAIYDTPSYQAKLSAISAANLTNALATQATDPGRLFTADLCWNQGNGCAGDIRLNDWATAGYGLVRPVLFTARDGATLSGHVWATVAGPARRPVVVITNGSVQADEQMYWYAAQTLAKAGYVVLTFDPQGQGQSDTLGEGADALEGVPAQTDGRPFYDGTEDAHPQGQKAARSHAAGAAGNPLAHRARDHLHPLRSGPQSPSPGLGMRPPPERSRSPSARSPLGLAWMKEG